MTTAQRRYATIAHISVCSIALCFSAACEEDALAPSSEFEGSECLKTGTCGDDKYVLDAGGGGGNTGDDDAGNNTTGPDAGDPSDPDSGFGHNGPDLGTSDPPDSGIVVPPSVFLDLNGTWNTRYEFDLSAYLFGISNIANEIDFIDQALNGFINTGFPPLDAFIISIVQQYVPSWVVDLVGVLNTAATLFDVVQANGGRMTIAQDLPSDPHATQTALHAMETWTEMVLYIVDQCPRGRQDPNFPTCAEFHVPVTHNPASVGPVEILVEIKPLEGTLNAGIPEADFRFNQREIDMELQKLVLLVVDTAVSIATPYNNLRDALGAVVNCSDLGDEARDFAQNSLGLNAIAAIGIGVLVEDQCNDALDNIVDLVAGIGVSWEAMQFDQLGHAIDRTSADGLRKPEVLQTINVQDTIDGRFRFAIQDPMGGEWEGLP
jgi:hypothetical protein